MTSKIKLILGAIAISLLPSLGATQNIMVSEPILRQSAQKVALFSETRRQKRIRALKEDAVRILRKPPKTTYNETALGCIAIAVYHESRGESVIGQKAVASVIVQRSLTPERWGDTPCEVVVPVQFSFMTSRYRFPHIVNDEAWVLAVRVALTIMYEGPMEDLKGADHYHANYVNPKWRHSMHQVARIGQHIFYSDPESLPSRLAAR